MDFLNTIFTFPTVVFTTLLLIVIVFWLIALLGFADIDMLEGDVELDVEGGGDSFFQMGFGGVPLTISISLVVLISWVASFYAHQLFAYALGDGVMFYLLGGAMMLACLVASIPLTALLVKPLRRFFDSKETASKNDFIGLECVIATSKVTDQFGQAKVQFQGTEQLIEVRSDEEGVFALGDVALLIEHDTNRNSYLVVEKPW
ncbi:ubiquinone biosynthesis protein UbiH [Pseudoalteromonas luteoviolacea]|uniref:Ubiquinone biosynthesis protein UbiH n=1 Tax=Pseudoalteromonas luteoviolacea TaxID=43657 RepID=A0A0C1MNU3_9GAMM|nr:OB-fold-containig protein [Pseudoalteromonas luteoviolacea]KID56203.1 ubiquinone biosynthesis protein UbiH [Pseudoalteromonas luteoviolacea]